MPEISTKGKKEAGERGLAPSGKDCYTFAIPTCASWAMADLEETV